MCGIAGFISSKYNFSVLERMLNDIYHRGPDGDGKYIDAPLYMGMRRLSIIDLEGGWQPLESANGQIKAFQNGEIYNYKELRTQLENSGAKFITESDTEVIAHGYEKWGLDGLLKRLDGMYAITIYDNRNRSLHLARDRFGEKPLYYACNNGFFAYGSSLKSLLDFDEVKQDIDLIGIDRYLALHFIPGERTLFQNVKKLLPGHSLSLNIDNVKLHINRYYEIPTTAPKEVNVKELKDQLYETIRSRLVADVPVGVFLSGGLDSSVIAAIAADIQPDISTFSMSFPDSDVDEGPFAREVAQHVGSSHYEYQFNAKSFNELLPKVAASMDEPIGDQACLPLYVLSEQASKKVKVVLSGEGADEVFGGYSYYPDETANKQIGTPSLLFSKNGTARTPSGFPLLSEIEERSQLIGTKIILQDNWEKEYIAKSPYKSPMGNSMYADLVTWLPDDLLVKLDRMAMAHSLEGRVPFLDPKIVSLGINLPDKLRMQNKKNKYILRKLANDLLPKHLVERKKHGFVLPMRKWIKGWIDNSGGINNYFDSRSTNLYDTDFAKQIFEEDFKNGINRERLLFSIIMLNEWSASHI